MTIPNRPWSTEEVVALDRHLVHAFADLNALKEDGARTAIGAAEGVHVWDCDGNKMLDGIGGLWCSNVGHGRYDSTPLGDDVLTAQVFAFAVV